jgi:MoaA/NifB/PqqE/SkfB family radical SAM enzyme
MYQYNELKTIHLEITERCNAACPMCARNINGGEVNPWLKDNELSLSDIKQIFSQLDFIKQLEHIYMCGNYGDPIVAQDTLEVFKYFRECNPDILLSMNTNGSARTVEWWSELATVLGSKGHVIFSIDGLEDTNMIYRKNTIWYKIIDNVKSFIDAGGEAHWEFIVFKHNQHQIAEARELASTLGFKKFQVKKSARFLTANGSSRAVVRSVDRKGNEIVIEEPTITEYQNAGTQIAKQLVREQEIIFPTRKVDLLGRLNPEMFDPNSELQKLYDTTEISCKVQKEKSLYISAEGVLQPCCWVAGQMYNWYHTPKGSQIWKLINVVGKDNINALKQPIKDIVESKYFQSMFKDSWNKNSCADGKLQICAKTCGKIDAFAHQYD